MPGSGGLPAVESRWIGACRKVGVPEGVDCEPTKPIVPIVAEVGGIEDLCRGWIELCEKDILARLENVGFGGAISGTHIGLNGVYDGEGAREVINVPGDVDVSTDVGCDPENRNTKRAEGSDDGIDQQRPAMVVIADPERGPPRVNKAVPPAHGMPILRYSRTLEAQIAIARMHGQPSVTTEPEAFSARKLHHNATRRNARRDRQIVFEAGVGVIDEIYSRIKTGVAHGAELRNSRAPPRGIAAAEIICCSGQAPERLGSNRRIGSGESHFGMGREPQRALFRQPVCPPACAGEKSVVPRLKVRWKLVDRSGGEKGATSGNKMRVRLI